MVNVMKRMGCEMGDEPGEDYSQMLEEAEDSGADDDLC